MIFNPAGDTLREEGMLPQELPPLLTFLGNLR